MYMQLLSGAKAGGLVVYYEVVNEKDCRSMLSLYPP